MDKKKENETKKYWSDDERLKRREIKNPKALEIVEKFRERNKDNTIKTETQVIK